MSVVTNQVILCWFWQVSLLSSIIYYASARLTALDWSLSHYGILLSIFLESCFRRKKTSVYIQLISRSMHFVCHSAFRDSNRRLHGHEKCHLLLLTSAGSSSPHIRQQKEMKHSCSFSWLPLSLTHDKELYFLQKNAFYMTATTFGVQVWKSPSYRLLCITVPQYIVVSADTV